MFFFLFERARYRTLPKNMSLRNAHPQGGTTAILFETFLSALRPVLCLKKCVGKARLLRGILCCLGARNLGRVLEPTGFVGSLGAIV